MSLKNIINTFNIDKETQDYINLLDIKENVFFQALKSCTVSEPKEYVGTKEEIEKLM